MQSFVSLRAELDAYNRTLNELNRAPSDEKYLACMRHLVFAQAELAALTGVMPQMKGYLKSVEKALRRLDKWYLLRIANQTGRIPRGIDPAVFRQLRNEDQIYDDGAPTPRSRVYLTEKFPRLDIPSERVFYEALADLEEREQEGIEAQMREAMATEMRGWELRARGWQRQSMGRLAYGLDIIGQGHDTVSTARGVFHVEQAREQARAARRVQREALRRRIENTPSEEAVADLRWERAKLAQSDASFGEWMQGDRELRDMERMHKPTYWDRRRMRRERERAGGGTAFRDMGGRWPDMGGGFGFGSDTPRRDDRKRPSWMKPPDEDDYF